MEYFQTAWRNGSSLNKGLTSEEFFYNQIYKALEVNVANRTLPFFNANAKTIPVELSTGKIINDENLIALDQISAKKGYSSNVWIYGDVLEKMQKEGISLNLRRDAEPVLCLTKYANYTHLNKPELYIAEGGAKTKAQYLYNYDSLDERSKKAVDKYFKNALEVNQVHAEENLMNYIDNLKKSKTEVQPRLEAMKNALKTAAKNSENVFKKGNPNYNQNVNFAPVINAQIRHMCQVNTGARLKNTSNPAIENACYDFFSQIIRDTNQNKGQKWMVGEAVTKAMTAGLEYAKSCTSHGVISIFSSVISATGLTGCPFSGFSSPQPGASAAHAPVTEFFFMGMIRACPRAISAAAIKPFSFPGPCTLPSTSSTRIKKS